MLCTISPVNVAPCSRAPIPLRQQRNAPGSCCHASLPQQRCPATTVTTLTSSSVHFRARHRSWRTRATGTCCLGMPSAPHTLLQPRQPAIIGSSGRHQATTRAENAPSQNVATVCHSCFVHSVSRLSCIPPWAHPSAVLQEPRQTVRTDGL
jgi:hypothetical protein